MLLTLLTPKEVQHNLDAFAEGKGKFAASCRQGLAADQLLNPDISILVGVPPSAVPLLPSAVGLQQHITHIQMITCLQNFHSLDETTRNSVLESGYQHY